MQISFAANLVLLVILVIAVVLDYRHFRISNRLILVGLFSALCLHLLMYGHEDLLFVLWNISFPVIVLYFFYFIGALGAGDIKLFSVIGGFLKFQTLLVAMGLSLVFGALLSLCWMIAQKDLRSGLYRGFLSLYGCLMGKRPTPARENLHRKNAIHFTLPILIGTIGAMGWEYFF